MCSEKIESQNYAVRDFKMKETRFQWWIRHVLGILTFNFIDRRNRKTVLPMCDNCVAPLKENNSRLNGKGCLI